MYGNGVGDVLGGNAVEWHCAWKTCWMFVKVERWEEIFVISASFDCDGGWAMRSVSDSDFKVSKTRDEYIPRRNSSVIHTPIET